MRAFYFIVLLTSITTNAQNYLDFYFKSRGVKGGIIIQSDTGDYIAFSDDFEGNKPSPPAATFHMFSYLMVHDYLPQFITEEYQWDGVPRYFFNKKQPHWNSDTNLSEAFVYKNDWFFQEMYQLIPQDVFKNKLKESKFTHVQWNNDIPYFWQFGGLMATPDQQIQFLKKLTRLELPFSIQAQNKLIHLLKIEESPKLKISGFEGYTVWNGERLEWFVGYIEKDKKRYFFSTRTFFSIEEEWDNDKSKEKFLITSQIFSVLGLI